MMQKRAPLLALVLVVAACGTGEVGDASTTTTTLSATTVPSTSTTVAAQTTTVPAEFPVTVESGGVTTTLDARPEAIVSLSPTGTEMLFAVGAGDQVVAVDEFSYYPEEAPVTDLSGFTPNLEAIAAYEPDLVVLAGDESGIVAALEGIGVPVLILPTATEISDAYDQLRIVGRVTGHAGTADDVAEDMESEIDSLVASIDPADEPLTYYHELGSDGGGSFYSVTSETFIGEVFGAFGLDNIADPADTDGFGYPLLSVEFILEADPDLIFYTDCCGDTPESIAARPGWAEIAAVRNGAVTELDDDLASRWGPRLVEFFRIVSDAITAVGAS